ncbi:MAG: thermonuclease family protein [Methylotenera sp.]|uniref:thermonuclease family protein n=1 Tax=Methylotenera sp. TaxID=2051956 RepID=UPI002487F567|nr:thermonuclease family protein [Methylotenera sp.]MDI1308327.1 thermonuclease family protein [Methylotenera sp.]
MIFRICFNCIFLWLGIATTHAEESIHNAPNEKVTYVKVTWVYDGDTVKLRHISTNDSQKEFKLRLTDIDAPERNQSYGLKSRRALMKLCKGKNMIVTAQISGTDKYQRSVGRLECNGIDASYYLAEHGLAWFYKQYSNDKAIENAAKNARQLTLGLWADSNPIAPWDWRHQHLNY